MLSKSTKVIASDGDKVSVNLTKDNIILNNLQHNVNATCVLWEDAIFKTEFFQHSDIIIASDVVAFVYEKSFSALLKVFVEYLKLRKNRVIYLAYEERNISEQLFFKELRKENLKVEDVEYNLLSTKVLIYRISTKWRH